MKGINARVDELLKPYDPESKAEESSRDKFAEEEAKNRMNKIIDDFESLSNVRAR